MFDQLPELFDDFLAAIMICYIIFKLNKDLKSASVLSYVISCLSITACSFLKNYLFPDLNLFISIMIDLLVIVLVILFLHKYGIYHSALTAFMTTILTGAADVFVALIYLYPLKLTLKEFKSSFLHISAGRIFMFAFICALLRLFAPSFIKSRRRLLKRYNKFIIVLSTNLIAAITILLYVYSLFTYYLNYRAAGNKENEAYFSVGLITAVLFASIAGTLYIINYLIFNRLKYDRLKMNNAMDLMTNTLNRVSGLKLIEEQLEVCKRSNKNLAVCFIDINDLKLVNDMHGHKMGDELIKAIVEMIKENIRETDAICRLGGDEFVVVFPGCNTEHGQRVMERITEKLRHLELFAQAEYTISFSYGFSEYDGDPELTVDGLLDRADQQMYLNKRAIKALV